MEITKDNLSVLFPNSVCVTFNNEKITTDEMKEEIILAFKVLNDVREFKRWAKVWKGTNTENGRIMQKCMEWLGDYS